MKRWIPIVIFLCLTLGGCSGWLDGSYVSVTPHQEQQGNSGDQTSSVSSYSGLKRVLEGLIRYGKESSVISVAHYDQLVVARDTQLAIQKILMEDPLASYAVESIDFELGTSAGEPALAVQITYIHGRTDPAKIQTVSKTEQMQTAIAEALDNCDSGIVLYVENYEEMDVVQWVTDYSLLNPDKVIEQPQVTVNLYPEEGKLNRVVELKFSYQYSRDDLRQMQTQVAAVFSEAGNRVEQITEPEEKYREIFLYLCKKMEEYQQETSITPAYSLLVHGVGDSRAVSTVYAAICRQAGLECATVTGTRSGEPWNWNLVFYEEVYYHVDVLRAFREGEFRMMTEEDMSGYVWDYSAYPADGETASEAEPTAPNVGE